MTKNVYPNKDKSIDYIRVISMFMILICHIANRLSMGAVAQLFQVGVQIFLLISGYLCAKKPIKAGGKWIGNRAKRVFIPIWIFALSAVLVFVWKNEDIWRNILPASFGIYGIGHIVTFLDLPSVPGFEHLWYITPLLISYLLVILLQCGNVKTSKRLLFAGLVGMQFFAAFFEIRIDYIVVFFVGYLLCILSEKGKRNARIGSNIAAVVFTAARVVMSSSEIQSNGMVYLFYIIPLCYNSLATAVFCDVKWVLERMKPWNWKWLDKTIAHISEISYEVYIVHYLFIEGLASVYDMIEQPVLATGLFLAVTFVAAEILHRAVLFVNGRIDRSK